MRGQAWVAAVTGWRQLDNSVDLATLFASAKP